MHQLTCPAHPVAKRLHATGVHQYAIEAISQIRRRASVARRHGHEAGGESFHDRKTELLLRAAACIDTSAPGGVGKNSRGVEVRAMSEQEQSLLVGGPSGKNRGDGVKHGAFRR